MGVVYRARNLALDRMRALKVVSPRLSADARFRERFRRESRLAASIEHPNVIPVHQAGEEGGHLYLAMRLVEGSDLRHMVIVEGPLEPTEAAGVIEAVAAGLDAAHAAGLIHRDVKPANVLVGAGADAGRVYLTDFGISRTASGGETVTDSGELVGTADYVAPEQIAGDGGRPPRRRLRARRGPALRAHRPGAVPARQRARDAVRALERAAAAAVAGPARAAGGDRPGGREGDGHRPGGALPVGRSPGPGAGRGRRGRADRPPVGPSRPAARDRRRPGRERPAPPAPLAVAGRGRRPGGGGDRGRGGARQRWRGRCR